MGTPTARERATTAVSPSQQAVDDALLVVSTAGAAHAEYAAGALSRAEQLLDAVATPGELWGVVVDVLGMSGAGDVTHVDEELPLLERALDETNAICDTYMTDMNATDELIARVDALIESLSAAEDM